MPLEIRRYHIAPRESERKKANFRGIKAEKNQNLRKVQLFVFNM